MYEINIVTTKRQDVVTRVSISECPYSSYSLCSYFVIIIASIDIEALAE